MDDMDNIETTNPNETIDLQTDEPTLCENWDDFELKPELLRGKIGRAHV